MVVRFISGQTATPLFGSVANGRAPGKINTKVQVPTIAGTVV
jgi:hypothetical protein